MGHGRRHDVGSRRMLTSSDACAHRRSSEADHTPRGGSANNCARGSVAANHGTDSRACRPGREADHSPGCSGGARQSVDHGRRDG